MYARQKPQSRPHPPHQSFASFVFGPESLLAYRAAQMAATRPGTLANPLYLFGGPGTGKTHLLKAIARQLAERPALEGILYFSAKAFNLGGQLRPPSAPCRHAARASLGRRSPAHR
jgi:chromosomal replication initiator protein